MLSDPLVEAACEGPVVGGMLDDDFYTYSMGQPIVLHYGNVEVDYRLTNRNTDVPLAEELDVDELTATLETLEDDRFKRTELHYVLGTDEYGDRMFGPAYMDHLRTLQRPTFGLEETPEGQLDLRFMGLWSKGIHWEVPGLASINGLRTRKSLRGMSRLERDVVIAEGKKRLWEKILEIKKHPGLLVCDFGTRRRAFRAWQHYVDQVMAEVLKGQFLGTSNVESAMLHDLLPMGTNGHQKPMIIAALTGAAEDPDKALLASQQEMLNIWWATYGEGLSIGLTDTFGSKAFFRDFLRKQLEQWKGFRHDSGDPIAYGEMLIALYESFGIDPRGKMLIFSDGLDLPTILKLFYHFRGRIKVSFGWGTNLTNDLGLPTRSLVIKPWYARYVGGTWYSTVKLSDNIAKAIGDPEEIERYKRVFGYEETYNVLQTV